MNDVGGLLFHQFSLPTGAKVDEQFGPPRDVGPLDSPQDAGVLVTLAVESLGQDVDAACRGLQMGAEGERS